MKKKKYQKMKVEKFYLFKKGTIDGKPYMRRLCYGFNALELLGILEELQLDIIQQMRGKVRPEMVERIYIKGRQEEP